MRVVVPTASICVIASTMNVRLPAIPTPAIGFLPETADPVEIDEEIQRLEHHRHQHEAGGFHQMTGNRACCQVFHWPPILSPTESDTAD